MADFQPFQGGSNLPQNPASGGFLQNLINAIGNTNRILSLIQQAINNSFVNLASNNVFTGTITFLGAIIFGVRVFVGAGTVTVGSTDIYVVINKTVGAATPVTLPATPASGRFVVIKDGKGDAGANNITISPAAGTIDGAATLVINTNFGVARLIYNGTQWNVV